MTQMPAGPSSASGHMLDCAEWAAGQPVVGGCTAACEAMLLAEKLGIQDQQALQDVLTTSFGCSEVLKRHMPIIAARYSSQLVGTCIAICWPSTFDRLLAAGHGLSNTSCQLGFHVSCISSFQASCSTWICSSSDPLPVAVDDIWWLSYP